MNESEFLFLYDQTLNQLQEFLEIHAPDIDCDVSMGIMTILLPNKQKLVINRQTPLSQLWLATTQQGYHLNYIDHHWICSRSQQTLEQLLNSSLQSYLDQPIFLEISNKI